MITAATMALLRYCWQSSAKFNQLQHFVAFFWTCLCLGLAIAEDCMVVYAAYTGLSK